MLQKTLDDYLGKSFSVFDEIDYKMSNLDIRKQGNGRYIARYVLELKVLIYDLDIEHVEKSSVCEVLEIKNGNVKSLKNLNGNFWYIK